MSVAVTLFTLTSYGSHLSTEVHGMEVHVITDGSFQFESFNGFGHPPGVTVGDHFPNRAAVRAAGVHRHNQAGITGTKLKGAESIVLSGGYPDDEDYGDVIIYTGHGGQDSAGRHIADQDPNASGNAALITSMVTGIPVRVIRGYRHRSLYSPTSGYRYDGIFRVESSWQERGRAGFLICRYRLVADVMVSIPAALIDDQPGADSPERRSMITQRIIRSSKVVDKVKALHDHICQLCVIRLMAHGRPYSEGAHIRPLGRPHSGPDRTENVLCLCANCHVRFDLGALTVADDLTIIDEGTPHGRLRMVGAHPISSDHLAYHRSLHC